MQRPDPDPAETTVVGVFDLQSRAVAGLHALLREGFERDQLGFAGPGGATVAPLDGEETEADTGSAPEPPALVEGSFADRGFGERAAQRLGAAYPDRRVTYDRRHRRVRVVARP